MQPKTTEGWLTRCQSVAGWLLLVMSLLVLWGWYSSNQLLVQVHPAYRPLSSTASIGFVVVALGFLGSAHGYSRLVWVSGCLVLFLGITSVLQACFGQTSFLDELIRPGTHSVRLSLAPYFGVPASFALVGIGLALMGDSRQLRWFEHPALLLATSALILIGAFLPASALSHPVQPELERSANRLSILELGGFLLASVVVFAFAWKRCLEQDVPLSRWLPLIVSAIGLSISMVLWQQLRLEERQRFRHALQSETLRVRYELEHNLPNHFSPLDRLTDRLARRKENIARRAAATFLEDHRDCLGLAWIDERNQIEWLATRMDASRVERMLFDSPLQRELYFERARFSSSRFVSYPPSGISNYHSTLLTFELLPGGIDEHRGLFGVYSTREVLQEVLNAHIASTFELQIRDGQTSVFRRSALEGEKNRRWCQRVRARVFQMDWLVSVWPTDASLEHEDFSLPKLGLLSGGVMALLLGVAVHLAQTARRRELKLQEEMHVREKTVRALHASEARYRSLVDNLEQGVYLKDRRGRYVAANKCFCDAVGCTEEEVLGKTDEELARKELAPQRGKNDGVVIEHGQPIELEEGVVRENKELIYRIIRTPVRNPDNEVVGVLGICWDVTEQRMREAQFQQAQKMEAVGQLAGGIAHDFNNLLCGVIGHLSRAGKDLGEEDPSREAVSIALDASKKAAGLVGQLLGFSRQTLLTSKPVKVSRIIDEVIGILRHTIDPRIAIEGASLESPWYVEADPVQLTQVVMNLCLNARDSMPEGGRLSLEVENVFLAPEQSYMNIDAEPGEYVRLRVRDTGTGIPAEVQKRMFEPFYTTKGPQKGTGLGLAMVFGIVKQHHGWIDCKSVMGQGTCFEVYLPCCDSEETDEFDEEDVGPNPMFLPPEEEEVEEESPTGRILLADDEGIIRRLAKAILGEQGHEVILAEDGQEAVEVFEREKDSIDLVILDMTMPRLSGQDAFHQMLGIDPEVRVLFASGFSDDAMEEEDRKKVRGFISKPYEPDGLVKAVREALFESGERQMVST